MSLFRRSKANKPAVPTPEEQLQQTLVPLATLVEYLMDREVFIFRADSEHTNMMHHKGMEDPKVQAAAFALHGRRLEVQALGAFVRELQELHMEEQPAA